MSTSQFRGRGLAVAALLLVAGAAQGAWAGTIAYDNAAQDGLQYFSGSLGMDFNVLSPILVTSLGVFDSGGDGFPRTVSVTIFDLTLQTRVTPTLTFFGSADPLTNGDRFRDITPVLLTPGSYAITAWGYGAGEPNGNLGDGGTPSTMNDGGGLIQFVGTGRFSPFGGFFPDTVDDGPANRYMAGTFQFTVATPEPGALTMGAAGLAAIAWMLRRRG